jgi:hypothetical protein
MAAQLSPNLAVFDPQTSVTLPTNHLQPSMKKPPALQQSPAAVNHTPLRWDVPFGKQNGG